MQREAQLVIGPVIDLFLPKGDVAYSEIKKIPAICGFKSGNGDISFWVKLLGDPA